MTLKAYREKRKFDATAEPKGKIDRSPSGRIFVVQKHASRSLHYDFRLEAGGVLKSWAVPKGPSRNPAEKRLAVQVEDHPLEYANFEGRIEEGQYGAGTVRIWDKGTWSPVGSWENGLREGGLKFHLEGRKLKGHWTLVRFEGGKKPDSRNWLLIKSPDKDSQQSAKTGTPRTGIKTRAKEFPPKVHPRPKKERASKKKGGARA